MDTKHSPEPWHYISGGVYARPEDADDPGACAIAMRASTKQGLPAHFEPTTKDANMARIVACVNALAFDDTERAEVEGGRVPRCILRAGLGVWHHSFFDLFLLQGTKNKYEPLNKPGLDI